MDLLETLIISSEKAANIARLLRQNEKLFEKLVEQKSTKEANPRFQQDFKTLADVLIQEMVKHDVGLKFPSIREKVYGEESNMFFSKELNKYILVEVKESQEATAALLAELLDDDEEVAQMLATEVHRIIDIKEVKTKIPQGTIDIVIDDLSIWIDPIDGTNEYVKGTYETKTGDFYTKGLKCVTVLIGVYDKNGEPVMGVINQPFFEQEDQGYQCHWGICIQDKYRLSSINVSDLKQTNIVCIGEGESAEIKTTLENGGFDLVVSRGAGYKLLTVVLGLADAYILSKPSTFFWDTCAPQAILRALGGNIVEMNGIVTLQMKQCLTYNNDKGGSKCNSKGIIAYRNEAVLEKLMKFKWTN
ncbi:unnamed protein product [Ceutorhynchus assimilis]|uniref:inositol-1,4-bisphosphate 1-phosphatase n=1 Tax=Ceutorhynchus assimilis TaxID=467358 RepID=A0A9N9MPX1_9CUCU|nr:unnamed protein product [Ceutorhynchus assimilis]